MKDISDFIYVKNILPEDHCDNIISFIEERNLWEPHTWTSPDGEISSSYDNAKEDYEELEVFFASEKTQEISDSLFPTLVDCCKEYSEINSFDGVCVVNRIFPPRFNRYKVNTKMHQHYDHIHTLFTPPIQGIPTLTLIGMLNDDFDGGEFYVFDDYKIETKKGNVIIFPSNFMYPHRVEKILKGIRYSFVTWAA